MVNELTVVSNGKSIALALDQDSLLIINKSKAKQREERIPYHQVISAKTQTVEESCLLEVYYLTKPNKNRSFVLRKIDGKVTSDSSNRAAGWVDSLMQNAYKDTKIGRRLKVLVNPRGGPGHAIASYTKVVEPIFRAADCMLDVTFTTHQGHAAELAKDLSLDYDVVVTVSGDGLVHEVFNGFAQHANPDAAFDIPLAPIPTGSGNGLCLNLLGLEDGLDVAMAALNVIKGRPMKTDIFTVTQNGKQSVSFMAQALGLMADLDIGTNNLRWMGSRRFVYGFVRGLVAFKPCPIQLSIKVVQQDKVTMAHAIRARQECTEGKPSKDNKEVTEITGTTPPAESSTHSAEGDGWITFDKPVLFFFAGQGPYVSREFMAFPVSLPDDGVIDIVVQELSTRKEMFACIGDAAVTGETYWLKSQHYFKAHAYRVKPLAAKGYCSIDGEEYPFEEYEVAVRPGLATLLSPYGRYAVQPTYTRSEGTAKA